jgi:dolichol-phosphate mannosyltransferase
MRKLLNDAVAEGWSVTLYPILLKDIDWRAVHAELSAEIEICNGLGGKGVASFLCERKGYYDAVIISRPEVRDFHVCKIIGYGNILQRWRALYAIHLNGAKEVNPTMESESEIKVLEREQSGCLSPQRTSASKGGSSVADEKKIILLSVIVPVYKEEGNIDEFLRRIIPILGNVTAAFEIIFAMDPSPDRTEEKILKGRDGDRRIKLLKFSRRFGQPFATLAGLQYSSGEAVVVIDVDLQDPPELITQMVEKWREGYDVVYAQRRTREGETRIKKAVSEIGYQVINRIADVEIPKNTGDFRLMSRRVVNEMNRLKESHGFLRGMVAVVGFRQTSILFDRPPRFSGKGNYNRFLGSLRIGFNGIFCFSNYALTLSTLAGFIIALTAFTVGILYAILKIFGFPFPLGNPTIVILVLFLGGIQLISIGILGEYIGRIYEEVRQRPRYIIERSEGLEYDPTKV